MIGRNHATIGAIGALAITPAIDTHPATVALTAGVAAGASVVADLDHPKASVSRVFPIIGPLVAHLVATAAGGHRSRTHTLEAAALVTAGAALATTNRLAAAIVAGVLVCFAAALLGPHLNLFGATSAAEFAIGALAGLAVFHYTWLPLWPLWVGTAIGYLAHLLADALTVSGIRPLMCAPRWKLRLARIRTGSNTELLVGTIAVVAFCALSWATVIAPTFTAINADLSP